MLSTYYICCIFSKTLWNTFTMEANTMNPDQTAPTGAVWCGSMLFAIKVTKIHSRWESRQQLLWMPGKVLNHEWYHFLPLPSEIWVVSYCPHLFTIAFLFFCLFGCCFKSQSSAMVMLRRSANLTTLFPGQVWLGGQPVLRAHTFACN